MKSHINTILIALAIIATALIGSDAFKSRNTNKKNSISVTGLGSESFVSDLIVWSGSFTREIIVWKQAYYELEKDKQVIQDYMIDEGLKRSNLIFSADINKEFKNIYDEKGNYKGQEFVGYRLTQEVEIESKEVEKVEGISRNISELINRGIEFDSKSPRYYYSTGLAELKLKMISAATKDANNRAKNIAKNAESKVGKLKVLRWVFFKLLVKIHLNLTHGVGHLIHLQKEKTASITMKLEYETE